jgi:phosphomannomutase
MDISVSYLSYSYYDSNMSVKPIISVSGLRGVIGESLTPALIKNYTTAYLHFLDNAGFTGPIVTSRDGRESGTTILKQIKSVVASGGRSSIDGGIMATPTVGIQICEQQAAGGLQITASHNPAPYNGLKLYSPAGRILNQSQGDQVLKIFHAGLAPDATQNNEFIEIDSTTLRDPHAIHIEKLLATVDAAAIRKQNFKVLLDSNHGAGSTLGLRLLAELGCQTIAIGDLPNGQFTHAPEPSVANLVDIASQVQTTGCDLGFCQDPDADRLALIDEQGTYIGEEYTLALCLEQCLARNPGDIVINCATSSINHQIAAAHNCLCHESAVGEANVVDKMIATNAIFGGEGNGGPIDPQLGFIRDSFVGMVRVLDLLASRQQTLSDATASLPKCHIHKTSVHVGNHPMQAILAALPKQFPTAEPDFTDGLKLRWPAGQWLLIRPSNTEPIIRAIAEASTLAAAQELCRQATDAIERDNG